ncbi:acyl-CoA reductase [Allomuricauda sp. SCSIO 65647]|uniref:acyl-CoA reductase n=1 Tax=Allomuricauda sp. SCSIO 65647 TaxID=2908843 RepID=UPI001F16BF08|nr:acyl-CoA reductase [Muricauda sp. SCSIO 65647]UJH67208.1 acyl-CoA reductase [Muricauda sp. SCSIO 65647]
MTERNTILNAFVKLGTYLGDFCENGNSNNTGFELLNDAVAKAERQNGWFTRDNILFALRQWAEALTTKNLENWLETYDIPQGRSSKTISIVMAGNIPLVGFHDFLSVLITGNKVLCKLSSNDKNLLPALSAFLMKEEPLLKNRILFAASKIEDFDAVIATGSNNTARYFEYYFKDHPHIIRKNRTSVAVLSGNETKEDLEALGEDIFRYFGLGCRNVSKLFVPKGYDLDTFFNAMFKYKSVINHHKYANNYDYNKAVYLMSEFQIFDNGFIILKKDQGLHSPIATLFYEEYGTVKALGQKLNEKNDDLQCVVSQMNLENEINFGQTQKPKLDDYADGIDTVDFLLKLGLGVKNLDGGR